MDIVWAFQMVHSVKLALEDVRDEVDQYHSKWFQQQHLTKTKADMSMPLLYTKLHY